MSNLIIPFCYPSFNKKKCSVVAKPVVGAFDFASNLGEGNDLLLLSLLF